MKIIVDSADRNERGGGSDNVAAARRTPGMFSTLTAAGVFIHADELFVARFLQRLRSSSTRLNTTKEGQMKRALIATGLAVTCAVSLAAQTYPQTEPKKADQAASKQVKLQGCLQAGEQPNSFVLDNVMAPEPKPGEPATTGTTGTIDPDITALKGSKLRLIGSPAGLNLAEHIGHTVEVTGALVPKDVKSRPDPGAPAGTAGAAGDMRRLNLKSVKQVATTCTAR